jgi:hypothetical protein
LYVWEAIAWSLHANDRPPDWCWNYLRKAATNISRLSRGRDFRHPKSPAAKVSAKQAFELVAAALLLCKQGQRNAFAALLNDQAAQRDANSVIFYGEAILEEIARRRYVTKDRAKRIVTRGKSLLR